MKKLLMLLIVGWMSMAAVYSQFTAGFYGVQPQIVSPNSPATIEFRFDGDGPVDFTYSDGVSCEHEYHISNSPYFFTVTPSTTTCYELRVVKNKYGNAVILNDYRFVTVIVNGSTPENVQMLFSPPDICKNGNPINLQSCFSSNVIFERLWFEGDGVWDGIFYPGLVSVGSHALNAFMFYDGSTYSTQRNISVLEAPQVTLWLPNEVLQNSNPFVLSGGRPSGGVYSVDGVVCSNTFDPSMFSVGWHIVTYTYTAPSGCQDTAETKIYIRASGFGIEEDEEDSEFSLYPNPTNGVVYFKIPCSVEVISQYRVSMYRSNSLQESVDLSAFPAGIYTLRLFDGEKITIRKIVKI